MSELATGPFATYAADYLARGWQPFPLPAGEKAPPPKGVTGSVDYEVDAELWDEWLTNCRTANIATRVPDGVLAIDVDHHDQKRGWNTIEALERRLGRLPSTYRVTSRSAGTPHGHYLYRVPRGLWWKSSAGPDVEVIHLWHRYLVAAGSVVEGRVYIAYDPDLLPCDLPSTDQLPELSRPWAVELCRGSATEHPDARRDLSVRVADWTQSLTPGQPSAPVRRAVREYLNGPVACGSAYDTMVRSVAVVVTLGNQGEPGVVAGLKKIRQTYRGLRGTDRHTDAEFARALEGAVQKGFGAAPPTSTIAIERAVQHG